MQQLQLRLVSTLLCTTGALATLQCTCRQQQQAEPYHHVCNATAASRAVIRSWLLVQAAATSSKTEPANKQQEKITTGSACHYAHQLARSLTAGAST